MNKIASRLLLSNIIINGILLFVASIWIQFILFLGRLTGFSIFSDHFKINIFALLLFLYFLVIFIVSVIQFIMLLRIMLLMEKEDFKKDMAKKKIIILTITSVLMLQLGLPSIILNIFTYYKIEE